MTTAAAPAPDDFDHPDPGPCEVLFAAPHEPDPASAKDVLGFLLGVPSRAFAAEPGSHDGNDPGVAMIDAAKAEAAHRWAELEAQRVGTTRWN